MSAEFSQLLEAARVGDQAALERIAAQYEAKLRIVARVQLGPALRPYLDSQDLVQSVHRSLMVGLRDARFDISSPDKLLALTLTMLRRKIARHWRRNRRQQRLQSSADASGGDETLDIADLLTSISTPQLEPAAAAQFRDSVVQLCRTLDPLERQIIDLRLEGFAAPEIATRTGLTSVNVRVRMTRLRQRLIAAGVLDDWL